MPAPLRDFSAVMRTLFRFLRFASYTLIGFMAFFLVMRVAEAYRFFRDMHAWAGVAFLVVFAALFLWFIGRPIYRFLRMPVAVRPPKLPPEAERTPAHLVKHLAFVERYVKNLLENPAWEGSIDQVHETAAACRALRQEAAGATPEQLKALIAKTHRIENESVAKLLAPLDKKVREVIRNEALGVGVATAVSWNGTVDSFIVLWRNCNLVSRIARIYYGRPGVRGTFSILRDVSAATLASAYLQDVSEAAGGALGSVFGKTVGAVAGPVMDGAVNSIVTLRIGYVAKARCRAFDAWTERTTVSAVGDALKEAGMFSKEVVTEVVRTVGGGLLNLPAKVLSKVTDSLSGLWKKFTDDGEGEPEPSGA